MTQTILLLTAIFVALIIAATFYWNNKTLKIIAITVFMLLANAVYFSLDGVKGWPAEESRDVKGILAAVVILNPSDSDPGAIYISLYPTTPKKWYEYVYPRVAPKTYYVKYSNDRAATFDKAKQAIQEGREVRINGIPPENGGSGESGNDESEESSGVLGQLLERLLPKAGDTYKPTIPDIEISEQIVPPEKGTNQ
jgi:hypothetical protein